jgi:hypothetical protein
MYPGSTGMIRTASINTTSSHNSTVDSVDNLEGYPSSNNTDPGDYGYLDKNIDAMSYQYQSFDDVHDSNYAFTSIGAQYMDQDVPQSSASYGAPATSRLQLLLGLMGGLAAAVEQATQYATKQISYDWSQSGGFSSLGSFCYITNSSVKQATGRAKNCKTRSGVWRRAVQLVLADKMLAGLESDDYDAQGFATQILCEAAYQIQTSLYSDGYGDTMHSICHEDLMNSLTALEMELGKDQDVAVPQDKKIKALGPCSSRYVPL